MAMSKSDSRFTGLMEKNKNKQNQSVQIGVNDYERRKLLRVEDNRKRMQDLGMKRIANSLTSLVDSQNMKKRKGKSKYSNIRDEDYNPDLVDDGEEDQQDIDTSVKLSKKKYGSKFIAPLSINRMANLSKKNRVNAPKPPQNFPMVSNAAKENPRRSTITMGELISKMQTRVVNKKASDSNCINGGSNRRSLLIDEDDDEFDGVYQGMEPEVLENEMDAMISQDEADQDDDYEEMEDITIANHENDIQINESREDLENHQLEFELPHPGTKKRGPTMLHVVHMRKAEECEVIICNEFGHVGGKFSRFLGTIARNHSYAPLVLKSWHKVPNKEKIWEYVLEKFDVPDAAKSWVLMTIGHLYKVHKCRFKQDHFYQYKDNKTRWRNRPKNIPEDDFRQLLRLWSNKDVEARCSQARKNRMSQKNMHTAGPKSFARIREEMKNDDPNKEAPSLTLLFERTRKRTEGRTYIDTYDDTSRKIEQMKNYKLTEADNTTIDPFLAVMNRENNGYRRLYGRGVTNSSIKKVNGDSTSYMISEGLMESFKENVDVEKNQLLKLRKEIEDDHERKKAELEAIREDIKSRQQNFEAMMQKAMKQLPVVDRDE